jgi:ribonuclease E
MMATTASIPAREERKEEPWRMGWDSPSETVDLEPSGNALDLINHPSYQDLGDNARRRRRRRVGDDLPFGREEEAPRRPSLRISANPMGEISAERSLRSVEPRDEARSDFYANSGLRGNHGGIASTDNYGLSKRDDYERPRLSKAESIKQMLEPPEVVSVEMTLDEQDIYELMGISPLVLLNNQIKNPKNTIISVTLPGEASTPVPVVHRVEEEPEFELEGEEEETPEEEDSYKDLPLFGAVFAREMKEEKEARESMVSEYLVGDTVETSENADSDDSVTIVRRRRRRSSAVMDE